MPERLASRPGAARGRRPSRTPPPPAVVHACTAPATPRSSPTASSGSRPASSSRPTSCLRLEAALGRRRRRPLRRRRRPAQPAYGACFPGVASFSPELFLRRRGSTVVTGPIKGTAAERSRGPAALAQGPRRARDDRRPDAQRPRAGRALRDGARRNRHPRRCPSRAAGTSSPRCARRKRTPPTQQLLRATFPPGSVTGAPKVQAMNVIAALEATGREVYTGAIGFASPNAGLELNVAIRTFEAGAGRLWLGAGGGIVADSDPARRARGVPRQGAPADRRDRRPDRPRGRRGRSRFQAPARHRPPARSGARRVRDPARPRRRAGQPAGAPRPARPQRRRRSTARRCREIDVPRIDGAVRIDYVPGRPPWITTRPLTPRSAPDRAHALHAPRRPRRPQVARPRPARLRSRRHRRCCSTPTAPCSKPPGPRCSSAATAASTRPAATAASSRAPRRPTPSTPTCSCDRATSSSSAPRSQASSPRA